MRLLLTLAVCAVCVSAKEEALSRHKRGWGYETTTQGWGWKPTEPPPPPPPPPPTSGWGWKPPEQPPPSNGWGQPPPPQPTGWGWKPPEQPSGWGSSRYNRYQPPMYYGRNPRPFQNRYERYTDRYYRDNYRPRYYRSLL